MRKLLIIGLISLFSLHSLAEEVVIYKKVDKNGKVTISDKPFPGATKKVIKTNTNVVSMPLPSKASPSADDSDEEEEEAFQYDLLAIDSPKVDEAIRANDGSVYIIAAISPQLQSNHSVRLYMDGKPVGQLQKVPYFSLSNVDRGTHRLKVSIIDTETNKAIQTSAESHFHLLRASINNRRSN